MSSAVFAHKRSSQIDLSAVDLPLQRDGTGRVTGPILKCQPTLLNQLHAFTPDCMWPLGLRKGLVYTGWEGLKEGGSICPALGKTLSMLAADPSCAAALVPPRILSTNSPPGFVNKINENKMNLVCN